MSRILAARAGRSKAEWWEKANALAPSLLPLVGACVGGPRVVTGLGLSAAEHETHCGDAWRGSGNWGACTLGSLSPAQRAALSRMRIYPVLEPTVAREAAEAAATSLLATAGIPIPANTELHVDSAPGIGPYFTLFARFVDADGNADDVAGAKYFAHVIAGHAGELMAFRCATSTSPAWADMLARGMYSAHYFTGFIEPHSAWQLDAGVWAQVEVGTPGATSGAERNVLAYGGALSDLLPGITTALVDWTPGAVYEPESDTSEPKAPPDLATTAGVQAALVELGASLEVDGIAGPKTSAALEAFQREHGLAADGVCGAATVRALQAALDAIAGA